MLVQIKLFTAFKCNAYSFPGYIPLNSFVWTESFLVKKKKIHNMRKVCCQALFRTTTTSKMKLKRKARDLTDSPARSQWQDRTVWAVWDAVPMSKFTPSQLDSDHKSLRSESKNTSVQLGFKSKWIILLPNDAEQLNLNITQ